MKREKRREKGTIEEDLELEGGVSEWEVFVDPPELNLTEQGGAHT